MHEILQAPNKHRTVNIPNQSTIRIVLHYNSHFNRMWIVYFKQIGNSLLILTELWDRWHDHVLFPTIIMWFWVAIFFLIQLIFLKSKSAKTRNFPSKVCFPHIFLVWNWLRKEKCSEKYNSFHIKHVLNKSSNRKE